MAEVSAAGLPALYVPLPHGNGEQALNSRALVESGAAVQVPDAELTSERLVAEVRAILDHPEALTAMRAAADASTAGEVAAIIAERIAQRVAAENRD